MTDHQRSAAAQRRRLGAFYTPAPLVDAVVARAVFAGARSVVDPACGDGRFLRATGLPVQVGVDIDASAALSGGFIHDDALRRDWAADLHALPGGGFDVLVGNPPFLSQMSASTSRGGRSRFGGGPYADAAAEFLALAVSLVRPGGRIGLVLPQSLLTARDAAAIRDLVDRRAAMRWFWWSESALFDGASVRVWAGVWEVGGTPGDVHRCVGDDFAPIAAMPMPRQWSALVAGFEPPPPPPDAPRLADLVTFRGSFRQHYYGLVDAVGDHDDGPPLITSGLIDLDRCWWGERPVRFAKRRFDRPRVDVGRVAPSIRGWVDAQRQPKLLIANQTARIEAVADLDGAWVPSVPVITAVGDRLDEAMDVLRSDAANEWVLAHAAGSGLSATAVRLTPALLGSIPLPRSMTPV